ncbi:hypothetical protein [Spirosoma radiotolerans]|uniref:hypothetical protein n=1 Tax=Spirosoma radiotolerans TaxID=1379870 RepID=UPI00061D16B5|nr:hypothetical protein [Spirosoma radiotolerans]
MKLTWTFYPKGEPNITLTVVYVPQLDAFTVAGYLEVDTNTAYVNWTNFRVFNSTDQSAKKALFGSLHRVERFDALTLFLP